MYFRDRRAEFLERLKIAAVAAPAVWLFMLVMCIF